MDIDKSLLSNRNVVDFGILPNISRLTVPRIIIIIMKVTNFDAKGAKRSVEMLLTTNIYKSFFKNILLRMNDWLSKIRSLHTYVIPRTVYFD